MREQVAREVGVDLERTDGQVGQVLDRIGDRCAQLGAVQVQLEPFRKLAARRTVEIIGRGAERDGLERLVVGDERRDLGLARNQAWPSVAFSEGSRRPATYLFTVRTWTGWPGMKCVNATAE